MPVELFRNGKMELAYFNFMYYPQRDINGKIIGVVDLATEVTPQAELNKKIKKSEEHFRQLTNLIPEKVSHADPDGKMNYFNQSWLNYTGLSLEELQRYGWLKCMHPDEKKDIAKEWQACIDTGNNFEMEMRCLNKNGEYKWHLTRAVAVKDENGATKLWIAATTEIEKLKEEEKRKEDFLKMVSHELKTPVTSMKGYVQLLLSILKKNEEIKLETLPLESSLERVDNQISKLTRLISEMLDLSRIEEGKLELQKTVFNLNELVDETVQDISFTNTKHHIKIHHDFKCNINADKDRIGQVLINFVTNAVKYSPDSNDIEVQIHKTEDEQVAVSIKDHGIGIAEKDQKEIFHRFHRVAGKNEETYSGLGIGLFLANEIIQRHHGEIKVESELGDGSKFSFILPYADDLTAKYAKKKIAKGTKKKA